MWPERYGVTVTVPVIVGWMAQWYVNTPAVAK